MVLKVIVLFCLVFVACGKQVKIEKNLGSAVPRLRWPTTYYIEATKYYMSSGLIENFKYWRSNQNSRVDADKGAVIKITIGSKLNRGKYEIHPETTEEETNKIVCTIHTAYVVRAEDFLPSISGLSEDRKENVRGIDCVKFTNEVSHRETGIEKTLWAYYDNSTDGWIPVRYKTKRINEWHGYLKDYELWDYSNFIHTVDSNSDVFKISYNCTNLKKEDSDDEARYSSLQRGNTRKLGSIPFPYSEEQIKTMAITLPEVYDLRVEGLVGAVRDRLDEGCKSAWAYTATAVVEGALARTNGGTWIKLSEQALLDCSWGYGNSGCKNGSTVQSYQWIMEHGLPTEQNYGTYTNKNGFCKMGNITKTFKIKGYTDVTPNSVEALKIALINHGPVSVNLYPGLGINRYDEGILYDATCEKLTKRQKYPMTLVGYGEKDGDTFWILKHSKGPYWGIGGYLHISARDNNCGVMDEATYAVA